METIKDYNRAFKAMRSIAAISLLGFIGATTFYFMQYKQLVDNKEEVIYVVKDNGTFEARRTNSREVSSIEINNHSQDFIFSMFAHDAETYEHHIDDAAHLIDEPSGLLIIEQFEKAKVKDNYTRWGSRTEVSIDSIKIQNNGVLPAVRAYFKQRHFIGDDLKTELAVALKYNIVTTYRSKRNPYALQITNLDFIPYEQTSKN